MSITTHCLCRVQMMASSMKAEDYKYEPAMYTHLKHMRFEDLCGFKSSGSRAIANWTRRLGCGMCNRQRATDLFRNNNVGRKWCSRPQQTKLVEPDFSINSTCGHERAGPSTDFNDIRSTNRPLVSTTVVTKYSRESRRGQTSLNAIY